MYDSFSGNEATGIAAVDPTKTLSYDGAFFDRTRNHDRFYHSLIRSVRIAQLMVQTSAKVEVVLYKSCLPWSKALAFEDHSYPNNDFLCSLRLKRSLGSICASIVHECVHALDATEVDFRHSHNGNDPNGKENTAPYWIGDISYDMVPATALNLPSCSHIWIVNGHELIS